MTHFEETAWNPGDFVTYTQFIINDSIGVANNLINNITDESRRAGQGDGLLR